MTDYELMLKLLRKTGNDIEGFLNDAIFDWTTMTRYEFCENGNLTRVI